jgi:hypothetical protein
VHHPVDLKSMGTIPLYLLERTVVNHFQFKSVCELLDIIPLTDFNVDLVLEIDGSIAMFYDHLALNRLGMFLDNDAGLYSGRTVLEDYLTGSVMNDIMELFVNFHPELTQEIYDLIYRSAVKIKVIKTITDESAVLLYPLHSDSDVKPLCGVYFDMALMSLSPLSIIPVPILN